MNKKTIILVKQVLKALKDTVNKARAFAAGLSGSQGAALGGQRGRGGLGPCLELKKNSEP